MRTVLIRRSMYLALRSFMRSMDGISCKIEVFSQSHTAERLCCVGGHCIHVSEHVLHILSAATEDTGEQDTRVSSPWPSHGLVSQSQLRDIHNRVRRCVFGPQPLASVVRAALRAPVPGVGRRVGEEVGPPVPVGGVVDRACSQRREFCHFAVTLSPPSLHVLKHLLEVEGGAAE